jgi:hypothetical protein
MNKRKGSETLEPKGKGTYPAFVFGTDKMDESPRAIDRL